MSTLKAASKKVNARSAATTVDEGVSNINYLQRKRISVLLTLYNTQHKQSLGLSAAQQLEKRSSPCKPPKCQS